MGTATLSNPYRLSVGGDLKVVKATLTMSTSYATSGDTLDILGTAGIGLNSVDDVIITPQKEGTVGGTNFVYNKATGKVTAWDGAGQVNNTTNLSSLIGATPVLIFGR